MWSKQTTDNIYQSLAVGPCANGAEGAHAVGFQLSRASAFTKSCKCLIAPLGVMLTTERLLKWCRQLQ